MAEDFLSFLVNETLKLQDSGESNLASLELKLMDYKLDFIKGHFIPQIKMLRFELNSGVLDVPINWKLFDFSDEETNFKLLNEKNDKDSFYKVLTKYWNKKFSSLLIIHSDGFCYVVGLKAGEENYLHDLINQAAVFRAA